MSMHKKYTIKNKNGETLGIYYNYFVVGSNLMTFKHIYGEDNVYVEAEDENKDTETTRQVIINLFISYPKILWYLHLLLYIYIRKRSKYT